MSASKHLTMRVRIDGMPAVHAARALFTALTAIDGILTADIRIGEAVIEHDGRVTRDQIRDIIESQGYRVADISEGRNRLPVL